MIEDMKIMRFALSKRYTRHIDNLVVASDGQALDITTGDIIEYDAIEVDAPELLKNEILTLDRTISFLYDDSDRMNTMLAFAVAINHNIRVLNIIMTDTSRYIDEDELIEEPYDYLFRLLHQLTYHLTITKSYTRKGLDALTGVDYIGKPRVLDRTKIDVLDISPYFGLTVQLVDFNLSVSVVSKDEKVDIIHIYVKDNIVIPPVKETLWNLYYDTDHPLGELIKLEMEKLGLLDLYLQNPMFKDLDTNPLVNTEVIDEIVIPNKGEIIFDNN